ncbi:MAG: hypothetical protein ABFQ95_04140 [Pseudomonadota bacterium]
MPKFFTFIFFSILFTATTYSLQATDDSLSEDPFSDLTYSDSGSIESIETTYQDDLPETIKNQAIEFSNFFQLSISFHNDYVIGSLREEPKLFTNYNKREIPVIVDNTTFYFYNQFRFVGRLSLLKYTFLLMPPKHRESAFDEYNAWASQESCKFPRRMPRLNQFDGLKEFLQKLPYNPNLWSNEQGIKPLLETFPTLGEFDAEYPFECYFTNRF